MNKITAAPKSLSDMLMIKKYDIHYFQREYKWEQKQIEEMIEDLTSEFLTYYRAGNTLDDVQNYGTYFMGQIIMAGNSNSIIDGQQRLTSLTLLLMYLKKEMEAIGQNTGHIDSMIYSYKYGKYTFNIDVDDRHDCMEAIYFGKEYDIANAGESARNLYARYNDVVDKFPKDLITNENLPHFCDWLINNVFFVEIVPTTEQEAHKVFVTMNDRGLNLTSTEMLKSYLLSCIQNNNRREELNAEWKKTMQTLNKNEEKGDEVFIRAWLRAQYAETIRESKAGATSEDFDLIGGAFHKWVQEKHDTQLFLTYSKDYEHFVEQMQRFAHIFLLIRQAETKFDKTLPFVYYNAQVGFTFQVQLILAPICENDNEQTIKEKINLVSRFIDLFIVSRVTRYWSVNYSNIKNTIFKITKDIRKRNVQELKRTLFRLCEEWGYEPSQAIPAFGLNNYTRKYIKHFLARITSFIEEKCDMTPQYAEYMNWQLKDSYEIEHITSDHYEWFSNSYSDQIEFDRWRNNIGDLLLLPESVNKSLKDKRYPGKLNAYYGPKGNVYSASLAEETYVNNPRFNRLKEDYGLLFKPYSEFGKKEITERGQLITQLVSLIWNTDMFRE